MKRRRHNSLDYACTYWAGDMNPSKHDEANINFGGEATTITERRCVVCRPFTEAEEFDLLGWA